MIRYLWLTILMFGAATASAFEARVVFKNNLAFTAPSVASLDRRDETYSTENTDPELESLILSTVQKTATLLPARYLPPRLTIHIERDALYTKPDHAAEQIPLSMVFTTQVPTRNEIRYSDFEMRDRPEATRTIVAHEVGHMLIEWACRAVGVTKPTDATVQSSHWVGSVYEGVADYIGAVVSGTTIIGSPGAWYSRDILQFDTLAEARQGRVPTLRLVEEGWTQAGLIPRYSTYVDLIAEFKKEASDDTVGDAYVEGPWLAGQLWRLGEAEGFKKVFDVILEIAVSGRQYTDPEVFLADVTSALCEKDLRE